jgi:hypothetical protein
VDVIHSMLKEVYEWFTENLKHTETVTTPRTQPASPLASTEPESRFTFSVYAEIPDSAEPILLCPQSSFHPSWLDGMICSTGSRLFQCRCRGEVDKGRVTFSCIAPFLPEFLRLLGIFEAEFSLVSPVSLVVRLAGRQRKWQLFVSSRNSTRVVSLLLKGVVPSS